MTEMRGRRETRIVTGASRQGAAIAKADPGRRRDAGGQGCEAGHASPGRRLKLECDTSEVLVIGVQE